MTSSAQAAPSPPTTVYPGSSSDPGPVINTLTPTLQWNASPTADYYALAIRENPPNGPIIYNPQQVYGTTHQVPSGFLKYGTKYRWNIQAHNSTGWSSVSNTLWFQTFVNSVTLTLYVHADSASGPVLSGALVTGYDGAGVSFSSTTNSSGYVTITGTPGSWQFNASKSGYNSNSWSQSITATNTYHAYLTVIAPSPPTTVYPGSGSEPGPVINTLTPVLQWNASPTADYYAIGISEFPYGQNYIIYNPQQVYGTTHQVPSGALKYGTKYRWNMQANKGGIWSSVSNTLWFQTFVNTVTLTLYVHADSASGPVIAGAQVTGSDAGGVSFNQATNSSGYVSLTGKPGTWQFNVSKTGYQANSWPQDILDTGTKHAYLQRENQPPTCSLSANLKSGKTPLTVTFAMSANDPDGSISSWVLDVNGDGRGEYSGNGYPPSSQVYTYNSLGTYTVALMVSDNKGVAASAIEIINAGASNRPPDCSLSAAPKTGNAPLLVTFNMNASDTDGSITNWMLNTGDGYSYSGNGYPPSTKTHTYNSQGAYTPTLAVSDDNNATDLATEAINVGAPTQTPGVSTSDVSNIALTSATLNGNLDSTGGETCFVWFEYGLSTSYGNSTSKQSKSSTGSFSSLISGLQSNTAYHFRARASNSKGTVNGLDKIFTTLEPVNQPPNPPENLEQFKSDSTTQIPVGAAISGQNLMFKGKISDPDGNKVKLQIELRRVDEYAGTFLGRFTQESSLINSNNQVDAAVYGLTNGNYHWQARTVDEKGMASAWIGFGSNTNTAADFSVNIQQLPFAIFIYSPDPPDLGQNIVFDASSSYSPDGRKIFYAWDFGDNHSAQGINAGHAYAQTGDYTVTLTVTDDIGGQSKYSLVLNISSRQLQEDINNFVSKTSDLLTNEILHNAMDVALATGFFAQEVGNDKQDVILSGVFAIVGYLPIMEVRRVSALGIMDYVDMVEKYPSLKSLFDVIDDNGWAFVEIGKDKMLDGAEKISGEIIEELRSNNHSYNGTFIPPLQKKINDIKGKFESLKNEVLANISNLTQTEIDYYSRDLQKRLKANQAISGLYANRALLPVTFREIKIEVAGAWNTILGNTLYEVCEPLTYLAGGGTSWIAIFSTAAKLASPVLDLLGIYQKKKQLNSDEQTFCYGVDILNDSFTQESMIRKNTFQGLKNIKDRASFPLPEGVILGVSNYAVGGFWGNQIYYNEIPFWAKKIYSEVTIWNKGNTKTTYELVAQYYKTFEIATSVPGIKKKYSLPFITTMEEAIEPGERKVFTVWYKNDGQPGASSSPGKEDIWFRLFGLGQSGMYDLGMTSTRFGTTKIPTEGLPVSEEELAKAPILIYPIKSELGNSTLYIYLTNPFDFSVQAELLQAIPQNINVISAADGTIVNGSISWQCELGAKERREFMVSYSTTDNPEAVQIPGAALKLYDIVNDRWVDFCSNSLPQSNVPKLALIGDKSVATGEVLAFTISAVGIDNSRLIFSTSELPAGATLVDNGNGQADFHWVPADNQAGVYHITFTVKDGELSDSKNVAITVSRVNRPPEFSLIGDKTVDEGKLLEFNLSAEDPNNDTLTYSASNLPPGAFFSPKKRLFSWLPNYDQQGEYTARFKVTDGFLEDVEEIKIIVNDDKSNRAASGNNIAIKLKVRVIDEH